MTTHSNETTRSVNTSPGRRRLYWIWLLLFYPAWLLLELLHEAGHVLHALLSGGTRIKIHLPLLGFSRTDVGINPHPLFVAIGGAIWGCILPVLFAVAIPRSWSRLRMTAFAFAGLCSIANGAYLAVGWVDRVGDAGDLMRHGLPVWALIGIGASMIVSGLWMWHRLNLPA